MNKIEKIIIGLIISLIASLTLNAYFFIKKPVDFFGVNTQYGMLCIYLLNNQTLANGSGTALLCDNQGRLIISQ